MSNFRFKKAAIYKLDGKANGNISNTNMTDAKAILFLTSNPARIKMFSKYPDNWKELIAGDIEVVEPVQVEGTSKTSAEVNEEGKKPCSPCERKRLEKMKMAELRETYPEAETTFGQKKTELVDEIIKTYYS